jgi:hypothetical protein
MRVDKGRNSVGNMSKSKIIKYMRDYHSNIGGLSGSSNVINFDNSGELNTNTGK